ncbi:MAG: hypothetical protein RLZ97_116 [Verrucomicrobiota bacterium]|jgi:hypothetical protein
MNRSATFSLIIAVVCTLSAKAAIVFSIEKATPGPITVGDSAIFYVKMASSVGNTTNLAGVDFLIDANDPGYTGTSVAGGTFIAGTNNFFSPNGGYGIGFPSSFQVFGANAGTGLTLTTTPAIVSTVTLGTLGATPGTYQIKLSSLLAVDPLFNSLPTSDMGPLSYDIVAVPEPGVASLAGLGLGLLFWNRRRR